MKNTVLAQRYARALYNLAKEKNEQDNIFAELRVINDAFSGDEAISGFLTSPLVRPAEKVQALEKIISGLKASETVKSFVLLLAKKNRLGVFSEITQAFQLIEDEAHGVTRGTVRSAAVLGPEDRKRIEELVGKATKKQVILSYKEDPSLLGGLVAEVGSLTLDDSLTSHLTRINEQLTRSIH